MGFLTGESDNTEDHSNKKTKHKPRRDGQIYRQYTIRITAISVDDIRVKQLRLSRIGGVCREREGGINAAILNIMLIDL